MASTYSPLLRYELIGSGEQAGVWGNTTNVNLGALVEQSIAGVTTISSGSLGGTTYTLTALNGAPDEARSMVLNFTGSAASAFTVVVPTSQKLYVVRNNTGQTINFKTAAQVTPQAVATANSTMIFCDGANVLPGIAAPSVGTLLVAGGGTGATTFSTGFIRSPAPGGTTALTSSQFVSLTADVSGTLPVANGGTGVASPTLGRLLIGNGTSAMTQLAGGTAGDFLRWSGSAWEVGLSLGTTRGGTGITSYSTGQIIYASGANTLTTLNIGATGQVLSVSAGGIPTWTTPASAGTVTSVAFSAGTTGLTVTGSPITTSGTITLAGTLSTSNGGTGLSGASPFTANGAVYATTASALTTGTLPVASGGTGVTSSTGSGSNVLSTTPTLTSPTLVTPALGTPSSGTLTNCTALPLTTGITGTLGTANGGTGLTTFTAGNRAIYSTSSSALTAGTLPVAAGGTGESTLAAAQSSLKIPYGPIFSAYKDSAGTDQNLTLVSGTNYADKVNLNAEAYDSAGVFDTGTSRFLPNVAGYYEITGIARASSGSSTSGNGSYTVELRKNGLTTGANRFRGDEVSFYASPATELYVQATVTATIYLNGISDYVEMWFEMNTNGTTPLVPRLLDNYALAGLTSRMQGNFVRYA